MQPPAALHSLTISNRASVRLYRWCAMHDKKKRLTRLKKNIGGLTQPRGSDLKATATRYGSDLYGKGILTSTNDCRVSVEMVPALTVPDCLCATVVVLYTLVIQQVSGACCRFMANYLNKLPRSSHVSPLNCWEQY